jgi:hypothetical protein
VRVALGALPPRGGGPPYGARRDTVRTVVKVKDVRVEAEGLQHGRVHSADSPIRPGAVARLVRGAGRPARLPPPYAGGHDRQLIPGHDPVAWPALTASLGG